MAPIANRRGGHRKIFRLGVMGGTFDPIHYGHLVAAEEARAQFGLDIVLFMPTGGSEHKETQQSIGHEDRYLMVVIATAANPAFDVSRIEVDREGPTYTIDTVRALRRDYGEETEIFFITGADAVMDITHWKDYEQLADYCRFIAVTRPGYDLGVFEAMAREIEKIPDITVIEVPALAISSTDLRRRIREGRSIRYLMPGPVANYIYKLGFYL
jgi:nicotinate-nucleotide adenylyltransferase